MFDGFDVLKLLGMSAQAMADRADTLKQGRGFNEVLDDGITEERKELKKPQKPQARKNAPGSLGQQLAEADAVKAPKSPKAALSYAPQGGLSAPQETSNEALQTFLAQMGLNLLGGGYGSPTQRIAGAIGAGGEAVGRLQKTQAAEESQAQKMALAKQRLASRGENARARRLAKQKKEKEAGLGDGLVPEAQAYLKQRIKDLNKTDPLAENQAAAPVRFSEMLAEAQLIDMQARRRTGMVRASEIPEDAIRKAAGNPAAEANLLSSVRGSEAEKMLLQQRLNIVKGLSANGR